MKDSLGRWDIRPDLERPYTEAEVSAIVARELADLSRRYKDSPMSHTFRLLTEIIDDRGPRPEEIAAGGSTRNDVMPRCPCGAAGCPGFRSLMVEYLEAEAVALPNMGVFSVMESDLAPRRRMSGARAALLVCLAKGGAA